MEFLSIWYWIAAMVALVLWIAPFWRILVKAGYPGILSILSVVPIVNLFLLWVFAFTRWPVEPDRAERLRWRIEPR